MRLRKINVEVTRSCDRGCTHCEVNAKANSGISLTIPMAMKIVEKIEKAHVRLDISLTGGEPLINPDFYDILKVFRCCDFINRISIITSGAEEGRETETLIKILAERSRKVAWCLSYNHFQEGFKKRTKRNLGMILASRPYGLKFNVTSSWENRIETIDELEKIFQFFEIVPRQAIGVDNPVAVDILTSPYYDNRWVKKISYGTKVKYAYILREEDYGIYVPLDYYPVRNSGRGKNMGELCVDWCHPLFTNHLTDPFIDAEGLWYGSWHCFTAKNFVIGSINENLKTIIRRGRDKLNLVREKLLTNPRILTSGICDLCKKITAEMEAMR
jgi:MoaA/NifB/PqqE/SkfB family radical SAM enzyme